MIFILSVGNGRHQPLDPDQGEGIRLRVGDWRVIMDDQGNVLTVFNIGPRGDIYD